MAEAPTLRLGLRVEATSKGANQTTSPGTYKIWHDQIRLLCFVFLWGNGAMKRQ
jgi:hypothetical protein